MLLTTLYFPQIPDGYDGTIYLTIQNTVNDPSVRLIEPQRRHCIFPDEHTQRKYPMYSYSNCVTECLRDAQIAKCNCTHYNLIVNGRLNLNFRNFFKILRFQSKGDKNPACDYEGMLCLDNNDLMFPQTTIMQPWRLNGLVCNCYPSCNEHEINVVGKTSK